MLIAERGESPKEGGSQDESAGSTSALDPVLEDAESRKVPSEAEEEDDTKEEGVEDPQEKQEDDV